MLDSHHWKASEPPRALPFELDGDAVSSSRSPSRRAWISTAEGRIARVAPNRLFIEAEGGVQVALRHELPERVDLVPLQGARVRVTLVHVVTSDGAMGQTLTIGGDGGRIHLVAHDGSVKGNAHTLGRLAVYVALSQRPGGPMVIGTKRLQSLVRPGDAVRVRDGETSYVMCFHARRGDASAAYVIADQAIWRG